MFTKDKYDYTRSYSIATDNKVNVIGHSYVYKAK